MRRFAANLGFLFQELPLIDRFAAARRAGFEGVELQGPGGMSTADLAAAARQASVEVVLCNAPVGDLLQGGPGLSGVVGREAQFREAIHWVTEFAEAIGCGAVNVGPSRVAATDSREASLGVLADNLRFAADLLGTRGIRACIEPVNARDFSGVLLRDADDAAAVLRACQHPNLFLQLDLYHLHQGPGDALATLEREFANLGHLQIADVPGRGPPGSGAIDFAAVFATLDRFGYAGWVGAEYRPGARTEDSLDWLDRYGTPEGHSA